MPEIKFVYSCIEYREFLKIRSIRPFDTKFWEFKIPRRVIRVLYNYPVMKKTFGLTHILTLLLLATLILTPRPLAGYLDLASADRFAAAGDYVAAADALASAAARIPWRADLWGSAAQGAWMEGNTDQALRLFAEGEARDALSLADWLSYGDVYESLGDMPNAAHAWQQSVDRFWSSAGAQWRLAKIYRLNGDFEQAIAALRAFANLVPDDADMHYQLGLLLTATAPAEAGPELMLAAQLDPSRDAAVQDLRSALNNAFLSDETGYQFVVAGQALAALGEWDLAEESFRRATAADPVYAEGWAWLGEARQALGRDGSTELERALALDPGVALVQGLYGLLMQRQGQPLAALESYRTAALLEPEDPGWLVAIAGAYEQSGDLINAADYYLRALELDRTDPANWRALAFFSLRNSVDVEAVGLPAARKLVELAPDDWQSYDLLGQALTVTGDLTNAAEALATALDLAPEQAAPSLHIGLVCLESGDRACAYDALVDATRLDPDGTYGWQAQRLLEQYFP